MTKQENLKTFLEKKWVQYTALFSAMGVVFSAGCWIGDYKADINCKIETLQIIEGYQDKIKESEEDCRITSITKIENDVTELKAVIKVLKEKKDAK